MLSNSTFPKSFDPDTTPDLASRVAELDRQRARVTILVATGSDAEACAVGTSLVGDARELGYRPLLGEAMVALGTAEERCPTDEDSAATIFAGVGHAEASGDERRPRSGGRPSYAIAAWARSSARLPAARSTSARPAGR